MSSDPRIAGPSQQAEDPEADRPLGEVVRELGEPLIEGLEAHAPGSRVRADAVGAYALATAAGLGFKREEAELCREAARLADVGRIYAPTATLGSAVSAENEGAAELERAEEAAALARGAGVPEVVCEWLLRVSEHYDGSGPARLSGAAIPVFSRIIRTAKRCDELVTGGSGPESLRALAGSELDPAMVHALASMLE